MKEESKLLQVADKILEGKTAEKVVKVFIYGIAPAYLMYLIFQAAKLWMAWR
jgi:hypothetical protein